MANNDNNFPPAAESDDLIPLPAAHRQGLLAVAILAGLSFASSAVVLLYLTAKLVRWHVRNWKQSWPSSNRELTPSVVDLSLGLAERHLTGGCRSTPPQARKIKKEAYPNQFLVLIYNLLLADIHQAGAFLLNAVWVGRNGIVVQTPACWVQGWLVSTGDLSSSCFITTIAVHTYLAVVRGYTPPQWAVYVTVVGLWVFNYGLALLGVAITRNGKEGEELYVRAAAWCWMNIKYETYRLTLHYLWIFISLAATSILYTLIFFSLRKQSFSHQPALTNQHRNCRHPNNNGDSGSRGHHKAFLLYPVIYVICTAPLALGRIATMAGVSVSISYFCTAGALITSNGILDVLLWGITRHRLIFGSEIDSEESGLDTFTFMRTPVGRKYGNMVWVEGCSSSQWPRPSTQQDASRHGGAPLEQREEEAEAEAERATRTLPGGWGKKQRGWRPLFGRQAGGRKTTSQESLKRAAGGAGSESMGIQMDMVTTVVVEERAGEEMASDVSIMNYAREQSMERKNNPVKEVEFHDVSILYDTQPKHGSGKEFA